MQFAVGWTMGGDDAALDLEKQRIDRFEEQATERVESLADDLDHLVKSRGMLILRSVL